jgi:hypothetical protein
MPLRIGAVLLLKHRGLSGVKHALDLVEFEAVDSRLALVVGHAKNGVPVLVHCNTNLITALKA